MLAVRQTGRSGPSRGILSPSEIRAITMPSAREAANLESALSHA